MILIYIKQKIKPSLLPRLFLCEVEGVCISHCSSSAVTRKKWGWNWNVFSQWEIHWLRWSWGSGGILITFYFKTIFPGRNIWKISLDHFNPVDFKETSYHPRHCGEKGGGYWWEEERCNCSSVFLKCEKCSPHSSLSLTGWEGREGLVTTFLLA